MKSAAPLDAGAGLLRYIAQVRERRLAEIRARAAEEQRVLLGAARARARALIRQALREARQDADARIGMARAAAQARLRQARHALTEAVVASVWERITAAVQSRWTDPAGRRAWVALALSEAQRHLPGGVWQVSVPADFAREACEAEFRALAEARPDVSLEMRPDPGLASGLRVVVGPALLDASAAGLLHARTRVEGRWLAVLAARQELP